MGRPGQPPDTDQPVVIWQCRRRDPTDEPQNPTGTEPEDKP